MRGVGSLALGVPREGPVLSWMNSPSENMGLVGLGKELGLEDAERDGVLLFEKHMVYKCLGVGVGQLCLLVSHTVISMQTRG